MCLMSGIIRVCELSAVEVHLVVVDVILISFFLLLTIWKYLTALKHHVKDPH